MTNWIHIFLSISYLLSLFLLTIPFVLPIPRRNYFLLRLAGICLVYFFLTVYGKQIWADTILGGVIENISIFLIQFTSLLFLFNCNIWIALYCVTGGYALQRINLHILGSSLGSMMYSGQGMTRFTLLNLFSWGVEIALAYLTFTRKLKKDGYHHMGNRHNLIICALLMVGMITFNAVNVHYQLELPGPVMSEIQIYSFICCLMTLLLMYEMFEEDKSREEKEIIRSLWKKDKDQMELSRETIDMINIKCHDLKHLLPHIKEGSASLMKDEVEQMRNLLTIYDTKIDTGNEVLNLILMEKSLVCQKKQVHIRCMADGALLSGMKEADVYSIFGNALDNAIRAVEEIENPEERIIHVLIKEVARMVSIRICNPYIGERIMADGLPVTDQKDSVQHGFGLRSMRYLAEKYEGNLSVSMEDHVFTLSILLPKQKDSSNKRKN